MVRIERPGIGEGNGAIMVSTMYSGFCIRLNSLLFTLYSLLFHNTHIHCEHFATSTMRVTISYFVICTFLLDIAKPYLLGV